MGFLLSPQADTSLKDLACFAWTLVTELEHSASVLIFWDGTHPLPLVQGSKRDSGGECLRWVQAAWPLLELTPCFTWPMLSHPRFSLFCAGKAWKGMPHGQTHPLPFLARPANTRVSQASAAPGVQGGGGSADCSQPRAHRGALQVRACTSPEPCLCFSSGSVCKCLRGNSHVSPRAQVPLWCRNARAQPPHSREVNQQLLSWQQNGGISYTWLQQGGSRKDLHLGPSHQLHHRPTAPAVEDPA